ncbi:hypothetical protein P2318_09135 [Myxococcaceae bacterium GXIMD 01537]
MARRKQPPKARKPPPPSNETYLRVRNLIAQDAANIMRRLEARRDEMFALFSRLRSREPMLATISTRFTSATFHDLVHVSVHEQAVVNHFYEVLDDLRWYFTYTEDMPSTAHHTFGAMHRRLEEAHRRVVATLGTPARPDGVTVVEGEVLRRAEPAPPDTALAAAAPRRRAPPA